MVEKLGAEKQAPGYFRAGTNVVLINATVVDRNQRPVCGLSRGQFRLFENKVEQRITYFSEEELPLSLVIVLDTSGSMVGKIAGATRALHSILDVFGNDDEFSLITVAERAEVAVQWTTDAAEVQNRAASARPKGRTALLDGIHLALAQLKTSKNARRSILILSDGGDNTSRFTERQISRTLDEADVQMYALDMRPEVPVREALPEEILGPRLMDRLCEHGAGRYYQVASERALRETAEHVAREMRSQYVLGFAPSDSSDDGLFHHVQVRLAPGNNAPKLTVYWRRGYRAPVR